jgi:hypothetical protein
MLAVMLVIAACGTSDRQSAADESGAAPASAAATAGATAAGAAASDAPEPSGAAPFDTVDAVGGGQIDGGALAGRDLALWFWAPW